MRTRVQQGTDEPLHVAAVFSTCRSRKPAFWVFNQAVSSRLWTRPDQLEGRHILIKSSETQKTSIGLATDNIMKPLISKQFQSTQVLKKCVLGFTLTLMGFVACTSLLCDSAYAQRPIRHELIRSDMPPGVAADLYRMNNRSLNGHVQPVQLLVPDECVIEVGGNGGYFNATEKSVSVGMMVGPVYRFRITNLPLPGQQAKELYPSIEIINRLYAPQGLEREFPIQVALDRDDLQQAIEGRMVTKVIYLEDPKGSYPHKHIAGLQPSFDVGGGADPLREAEKLGRPMAILRMGSRVPMPGDPAEQFDFGTPTPQILAPPQGVEVAVDKESLQQNQDVPEGLVSSVPRIVTPSELGANDLDPIELDPIDVAPEELPTLVEAQTARQPVQKPIAKPSYYQDPSEMLAERQPLIAAAPRQPVSPDYEVAAPAMRRPPLNMGTPNQGASMYPTYPSGQLLAKSAVESPQMTGNRAAGPARLPAHLANDPVAQAARAAYDAAIAEKAMEKAMEKIQTASVNLPAKPTGKFLVERPAVKVAAPAPVVESDIQPATRLMPRMPNQLNRF